MGWQEPRRKRLEPPLEHENRVCLYSGEIGAALYGSRARAGRWLLKRGGAGSVALEKRLRRQRSHDRLRRIQYDRASIQLRWLRIRQLNGRLAMILDVLPAAATALPEDPPSMKVEEHSLLRRERAHVVG